MNLTVLGSNGTYGTPGRPPSGYLVTHGDTNIWLDAGPGTFAALQDQIDMLAVDAIVLSHAHGDHCLDIFGFYHAVRYGGRPFEAIPTYVPEGLPERLLSFLGRVDHPISEVLDFRVMVSGSEAEVGPISLRFGLSDHPVPTLCVRIEADGRSLTYSADTGTGGELEDIAAGTDLLLCEATYQGSAEEKTWPHHLTAGEAGEIARRSRARRLVLTHLWPTLDPNRSVAEAEATFDRPVGLAVPGARLKV